jgi:hypothetical protein
MAAIQSNLPYENAMTNLIGNTFKTLEAVPSERETFLAMEAVHNIWWTRNKHLPNRDVMLKRQLSVYNCVEPMRVPGWDDNRLASYDLRVPVRTKEGLPLAGFYELEFKLNFKFPVKEIFASKIGRSITQADFGQIIKHIEREMRN